MCIFYRPAFSQKGSHGPPPCLIWKRRVTLQRVFDHIMQACPYRKVPHMPRFGGHSRTTHWGIKVKGVSHNPGTTFLCSITSCPLRGGCCLTFLGAPTQNLAAH